jgi:hypothetical protein
MSQKPLLIVQYIVTEVVIFRMRFLNYKGSEGRRYLGNLRATILWIPSGPL